MLEHGFQILTKKHPISKIDKQSFFLFWHSHMAGCVEIKDGKFVQITVLIEPLFQIGMSGLEPLFHEKLSDHLCPLKTLTDSIKAK